MNNMNENYQEVEVNEMNEVPQEQEAPEQEVEIVQKKRFFHLPSKKTCKILAGVGIVAAVGAGAFGAYKYFTGGKEEILDSDPVDTTATVVENLKELAETISAMNESPVE